MKKIIKFLFSLIVIVLVSVCVVVIMLYDNSDINKDDEINKNKTPIQIINNSLYEGSLDSTTSKEVSLLLDEDGLESLFYPIIMGLNDYKLGVDFTNADIDVINGEYYLEVSIIVNNLFKSIARTQLKFMIDNNVFYIYLEDLKLGKINFYNLGKKVLNMIDLSELENDLNEQGILLDINFDNMSVSMSFDDLKNMLLKNINDGNKYLVLLLFDVFLSNENLMKLCLGDEELLGAILYLQTAEYVEEVDGKLIYDYNFQNIKNDVEILLRDNIINENQLNVVFNFLIKGYKSLSDKDKNIIDKIDLSSLSISSNSSYEGVIDRSGLTLNNYFSSLFEDKNILESTNMLLTGINIPDNTLNAILQNFEFIGYSYAFNDYNNNVGYFTIEQVDIICEDQFIDLILVVNINELKIFVEVTFDCYDNDGKGLKVIGKIHDVSFGHYMLNDVQKDDLINYLEYLFENLGWISISSETNSLTLDFSSAISDLLSNNPTLKQLIGSSIDDVAYTSIEEGYIKIKFDLIN